MAMPSEANCGMSGRWVARVIKLDHLLVQGELDELARADAARRLMTLLQVPTDENRTGGTGKAIKVINSLGESFCLKSLRPVQDARLLEEQRKRAFAARTEAFAGEYTCQSNLTGVPGIPRAYGYGTFAGGPIMLMEWLSGHSLREALLPRATRLANGLSVRVLSAVGASVTSILLAARERDPLFVHRDLSGMNVMVCTDSAPLELQIASGLFDLRLIDFGSAWCRSVVERNNVQGPEAQRIWRNATPEYAPPEMLTHHNPVFVAQRGSELIDSYELCGILYELYCGYTPYQLTSNNPRTPYLYKLEHLPATPPLRRPDDDAYVQLVMEGLARDQTQRLTLRTLHQRLLEVCYEFDPELSRELARRHGQALDAARMPMPQGTTDLSPQG